MSGRKFNEKRTNYFKSTSFRARARTRARQGYKDKNEVGKYDSWKELLIKTQLKNRSSNRPFQYDIFQNLLGWDVNPRWAVLQLILKTPFKGKITIKFCARKNRNGYLGPIKPIDLKQKQLRFSQIVLIKKFYGICGKTELQLGPRGPSVGMAASVIADGRYAEVILKQIDGADRLYFYQELGVSERLF